MELFMNEDPFQLNFAEGESGHQIRTLITFHAYPECIDIPSQLLTDSILQHFHHLQLVFYWALGLQIGSAVADENQFLQSVDQQIVLSVFAVGFELIPRLFVLLSLCYFFVSLFIALIY